MKPDELRYKFAAAAESHAVEEQASLPDDVDRIVTSKDAAEIYTEDFIRRCAGADDDSLFEFRQKFKVLKDFSVREFDKRIKRERLESFKSTAGSTSNGHGALPDWHVLLDTNDKGVARASLKNAMIAFRHAPEWHGVIAYDQLACRATKLKPPPWKSGHGETGFWTDGDDIRAAEWLQQNHLNINISVTASAIQGVAEENAFHPIREYLHGLVWDGEKRISGLLTNYFGVPFSEYVAQVSRKWLIAAVARVMKPGCQVDTCLVLEGEQGIRKSTALRILASDEWFTDQLADLDNKDSSQDLSGKWIVEFSDLGQMNRAEQGVLKAFLTRRVDHYRKSYGRRTADFPRQQLFSATTNRDTWSGDETGGRRWWPVRCGKIDTDLLAADRDQLWAEALAAYEDGEHWWLEDDAIINTAREEQAARFETHVWDELVWNWVRAEEEKFKVEEAASAEFHLRPIQSFSVSVDTILGVALNKAPGSWSASDKANVARILVFHGLVRFKKYLQAADGSLIRDDAGEYLTERRYKRKTTAPMEA